MRDISGGDYIFEIVWVESNFVLYIVFIVSAEHERMNKIVQMETQNSSII